MPKKSLCVVLLGGLLLGATAVGVGLFGPRDRLLDGYDAVETGMSEARVLELLGPPAQEGPQLRTNQPTERQWRNAAYHSILVVGFDADGRVGLKAFIHDVGGEGKQFHIGPPPTWWQRTRTRLGL